MPAEMPDFDAPDVPRQRARAPIDYRSRNAKVRLFLALGGVILILALAERARDPASWNWLFGLKSKTGQIEKPINNKMSRTVASSEEPETVFLDRTQEKALPQENTLPKVNAPPKENEATGSKKNELQPDAGPLHDAWLAAWRAVWKDLGTEERTLLFRLVEAAADGKPFPAESTSRGVQSIATVNDLWSEYQAAAYQEFSGLPGDEKTKWLGMLEQVNARWKELKRSLELVSRGGVLTDAELKTVAEFEHDAVQVCLTHVRDDATFLRPDENQLWFHLLHELQTQSPQDLVKKSLGTVGYGAMYNQPEAFRGKLVTVKAQVRWAYRVPAIKNYLGVKEFNVLYLAPEGVPDKPLVVYSLTLPAGFPKLEENNHPSGMKALHEDVVLTGYFFKRGAYRGKDANITAPLLLANSFEWIPAKGQEETFARGASIWRESIVIAVVVFAVAAISVYFVVRSGGKPARRFEDEKTRAEVGELKNADLPPTLQESLKKLAEEGGSKNEP
jgi:hypothetical protein